MIVCTLVGAANAREILILVLYHTVMPEGDFYVIFKQYFEKLHEIKYVPSWKRERERNRTESEREKKIEGNGEKRTSLIEILILLIYAYEYMTM